MNLDALLADSISSWRNMMLAVPPPDRLLLFEDAAGELAQFICRGFNRVEIANTLEKLAAEIGDGLDDINARQRIIATAISKVANGHDQGAKSEPPKDSVWRFHSTEQAEATAALIKGLLPATGCGLLAGQWGMFKTTIALAITLAVMTGELFADRFRVKRRGGVVYFAPEGSGGLSSRLTAAARARGINDRLPFAYRADCPPLTAPDAVAQMTALVKEASEQLKEQFGVDVVLVWVDTVIAASGYAKAGDENDAALGQKIMGTLSALSQQIGALVLGIDHFGKDKETGTRGSSAKEAHADVVLAAVGERELTGAISKTQLALRKLREGEAGMVLPFTPRTIEVGRDEDGDAIKRVVIEWPAADAAKAAAKGEPDPWKKKSLRRLRLALMNVLVDHGRQITPLADGPTVRAVDIEIVREQFYRAHPAAEGTDAKTKASARRQAFNRAIDDAQVASLIGCWESEGITWIWLINPATEPDRNRDEPQQSQAAAFAAAGRDPLDEGVAHRPRSTGGNEVISPEPPGTKCEQCGRSFGTVYLLRNFRSARSVALHMGECEAYFAENTP